MEKALEGTLRRATGEGWLRAHLLPLSALAALYLLWGSTYFAIRVALESFPPFVMGGARFVVAGGALFCALRMRGAPLPTRRECASAAAVGILLLPMSNGLVVYSELTTGSSVVALVMATTPLWAAVFGRFFGRSSTRGEWTGLLVGFVGVALLNLGGDLRSGGAGALLVLIAPMTWALGSMWSARLKLPAGAMSTAVQMVIGGAVMLAVGLVRGESVAHLPTLRSGLALGYLVVFGSLVGFSAYGYLLRTTSPAVATSYAYVNPLVALALGVVLGGERLRPLTAASAFVILSGVVILSASKYSRRSR